MDLVAKPLRGIKILVSSLGNGITVSGDRTVWKHYYTSFKRFERSERAVYLVPTWQLGNKSNELKQIRAYAVTLKLWLYKGFSLPSTTKRVIILHYRVSLAGFLTAYSIEHSWCGFLPQKWIKEDCGSRLVVVSAIKSLLFVAIFDLLLFPP